MILRKRSYRIRSFVCPECGTVFTFPKSAHKMTPNGHIKDAYCYKCKKEQKLTQIEKEF